MKIANESIGKSTGESQEGLTEVWLGLTDKIQDGLLNLNFR